MPKTYQWTRISLYFENISKKMQVFGFKGVKNGYKVKKDILSAQDILLALFGSGEGGLQPFWSHITLKSFPITPSEKIPPASLL